MPGNRSVAGLIVAIALAPYIRYQHRMIVSTLTYKSGNSEAVRLPKGIGFGVGTRVRIEREGNRIVLTPDADADAWRRDFAAMAAEIRAITGPEGLPREERDTDWWPDRPNL